MIRIATSRTSSSVSRLSLPVDSVIFSRINGWERRQMRELEMLKEALRLQQPHAWVVAALKVLAKPGVAFVGKSTNGVPVSHLVRVYTMGLESTRQQTRVPTGVESLLNALQTLPRDAMVTIESVDSGDKPLITAIWAADSLLGCVVADDLDNTSVPNKARVKVPSPDAYRAGCSGADRIFRHAPFQHATRHFHRERSIFCG